MSDQEVIHMSGPTTPQQEQGQKRPQRIEKKNRDVTKAIIPISAGLTGILTALAAPELVDASGIIGASKVILLGGAAAFVSGVVNHYAIKNGPELAARGLKLAAVSSALPVFIVGISATAFSYSGLTIKQVNELNLQEHTQKLSAYSEDVNAYASQIGQLSPVVNTAAKVIERNLQCEESNGCLSKGIGGKGTTYRAMLPISSQAQEIAVQLKSGETFRKNQLALINKLAAEYQENLSKSELSYDERRRVAARNSARIKQEISPLREALPLALLRGYGDTLKAGITISGNQVATRNVNALLARHGISIGAAVDSIKPDKSISPELPSIAGVSQAFERFDRFWPIGILTASIELLIPITLWLFAYLSVVWKIYEDEHTPDEGEAK